MTRWRAAASWPHELGSGMILDSVFTGLALRGNGPNESRLVLLLCAKVTHAAHSSTIQAHVQDNGNSFQAAVWSS